MKKLFTLLICLFLFSSCVGESNGEKMLSPQEMQSLINRRTQWLYWVETNTDSVAPEIAPRLAENLQNAIEHEYHLRNEENLDGSLEDYGKLAAEYYSYDENAAIELLQYSSNLSHGGKLEPVDDWREENRRGMTLVLLQYAYKNGVYDTMFKINFPDGSHAGESYARYSFVYTDDGFVNFKNVKANFNQMFTVEENDRELILYSAGDSLWQADLVENYTLQKSMLIDESTLPAGTILIGQSDLTDFKQVDFDGEVANFVSNTGLINLTIDFNKEDYHAEYIFKKDDVLNKDENETYPEIVEESNKNLLVRTAGQGGGDAYYDDLWLFEADSDVPIYLESIGGMYGGGADCGFFKNGDIYVMSNLTFHIYRKGVLDLKLEDLFLMSSEDGKIQNYFSSVRRNTDNTFTIIYSPVDKSQADWEKFVLDTNYKIAVMDRKGKIIKDVETDEPVRWSLSGPCPVDMSVLNENTIRFAIKDKGSIVAQKDVII